MKLTKIILISLFLIFLFTGVAFAKTGTKIDDFDLPFVQLGINLTSNGVSNYNHIDFNLNNFNLDKSLQNNSINKTARVKALKTVSVILTTLGMVGITSSSVLFMVSIYYSDFNADFSFIVSSVAFLAYPVGVIMGAVVSGRYSSVRRLGGLATGLILGSAGSIITGLIVLDNHIVSPSFIMNGILLLIPGFIFAIKAGLKKKYNNENNVEVSLREEDGAVGFSW